MTTIQLALKEAKILKPRNERAWNWLKDNGAHTATEIGVAVGMDLTIITSVLSQMYHRGMVQRVLERRPQHKRPVYVYSVNPKMRYFEVLPVLVQHEVKPPLTVVKAAPQPEVTLDLTPPGVGADEKIAVTQTDSLSERPRGASEFDPDDFLDTISVKQARILHDRLAQMFGGAK